MWFCGTRIELSKLRGRKAVAHPLVRLRERGVKMTCVPGSITRLSDDTYKFITRIAELPYGLIRGIHHRARSRQSHGR